MTFVAYVVEWYYEQNHETRERKIAKIPGKDKNDALVNNFLFCTVFFISNIYVKRQRN